MCGCSILSKLKTGAKVSKKQMKQCLNNNDCFIHLLEDTDSGACSILSKLKTGAKVSKKQFLHCWHSKTCDLVQQVLYNG